jgi:uncharacterized cupredoxin-like copper-binding protein
MRRDRFLRVTALVVLACAGAAACSSSSSNKSSTSTTAGGGGVTVSTAATGTTINVVLGDTKGLGGPMTMVVSPATAKAGNVTFVVKNNGTIEHEMIVLKTPIAFDKLPITYAGDPPAPVTTGADKVGEDANVGETGDPNLKPGDTRTFTIKDMVAGKYALVCNIAKHYGLAMRAPFVVTP